MRSILAVTAFMFIAAVSAHADEPDEVIEIHDIPAPKVMPKPTSSSYDPMRLPEYSDKAKLDDVWVRAWLMLDIDSHGKVLRFKFLNHPGYDLEPMAIKAAFSVAFSPGLDNHDRPTHAFAIWRIEWPAYGWLAEIFHNTARWPEPAFTMWGNVSPAMFVPCRGEPLDFNSKHPVLRDCSQPDISHVDAELWVYPDGHRAAPRDPRVHDHFRTAKQPGS